VALWAWVDGVVRPAFEDAVTYQQVLFDAVLEAVSPEITYVVPAPPTGVFMYIAVFRASTGGELKAPARASIAVKQADPEFSATKPPVEQTAGRVAPSALFSATKTAFCTCSIDVFALAFFAFLVALPSAKVTNVAKIPIITTTIKSSTNVNAFLFILPPL